VVSRRRIWPDELDDAIIAIPGQNTTANLLFSIFWPAAVKKREYLFSDIPEAVLSGEADAGVIIHETRFTYRSLGLQKIADTGEMWEEQTGMPLPLGGIVINRRIEAETARKVSTMIRRSIEYAYAFPSHSVDFIRKHASETDARVTQEHIKLYVNEYSLSLGQEGREAVERLFSLAQEKKVIAAMPAQIFLH